MPTLIDLKLVDPVTQAETLGDSGPWGAAAIGPARIAQRVAYELLTPSGSVAGRESGTDLINEIDNAGNTGDFLQAFTSAATVVIERLNQEADIEGWPDADRVKGIWLTELVVSGATADMRVKVVLDGVSTVVNLSVRFAPAN